jgi:hypothetical protein
MTSFTGVVLGPLVLGWLLFTENPSDKIKKKL